MRLFDQVLAGSLPWLPRWLVGRVAARYVAGETEADAFRVVRDLNARGMAATLDILGEDVTDARTAAAAAGSYLALLDSIARERVDSNVSLKLTQLGLKVDPKRAEEHLRTIVVRARDLGNFVRIDMEDSSCTDATLDIFAGLRPELPNVGVVLQAMLRRTVADARALAAVRAGVRVCKGIYREPESIAWQERDRIRESFMTAVETLLRGGSYVGIATHDEWLVERALALVADLGLPRTGRHEFQMLLGVREALRDSIVAAGHRLRVYVPFGPDWYAYSLRRLRENPAIARHVARALVTGGR